MSIKKQRTRNQDGKLRLNKKRLQSLLREVCRVGAKMTCDATMKKSQRSTET